MGPSRSFRLFGTAVRCHLVTLALQGLLAYGAVAARDAGLPLALLAWLALLTAAVLHELVRGVAYRRCGVAIRRLDLLVAGGSPRLRDLDATPRAELLAGLAGLVCSLFLSLPVAIAVLFGSIEERAAWFRVTAPLLGAVGIAQTLPALPLDAGRIVRALVWELGGGAVQSVRAAAAYGHLVSATMIAGGAALLTAEADRPYWGFAAVGFGLQLVVASAAAVRDAIVQETGRCLVLADLGLPHTVTVAASAQIEPAEEADWFLTRSDGGPASGVVRRSDLRRIPRRRWAGLTWRDVAKPLAGVPALDPSTSATEALYALESSAAGMARFEDRDGEIRLLDAATVAAAILERAKASDASASALPPTPPTPR